MRPAHGRERSYAAASAFALATTTKHRLRIGGAASNIQPHRSRRLDALSYHIKTHAIAQSPQCAGSAAAARLANQARVLLPFARERKSQTMKLKLIYLPVLLLGSQIVLAADLVPKIDIGRSCQSAGAAAVMATRDTAACERDENNARATLEKEWSQFTPSDQARCARLVTLGGGLAMSSCSPAWN
jgi:hypothetical protein